jgi:uncharacterized membrane protein (DUF485 family)
MYQGGLSIGDGFKFGCGFILAQVVAGIIVGIAAIVISLVLGAIGMSMTNMIPMNVP